MNAYSTANEIAKYYLNKESMTPKKLQKILYYAYSWTLTIMNESSEIENKLFYEEFQAWIHGPVIPEIYEEYKCYGWQSIDKIETYEHSIDKEITKILDEVWEAYKGYSANELESISHQEKPWILARNGIDVTEPSSNQIDDKSIFDYYSNI